MLILTFNGPTIANLYF